MRIAILLLSLLPLPSLAAENALVFLIAGQSNAGGVAAFSPETNVKSGLAKKHPTIPGSTAKEVGIPTTMEAYPRSYVWGGGKFETAGGTSLSVGIGGTHPTGELQLSYLEAQTALRATEQSGQPVVSYPDLGALPSQRRFPVEARTEFLLEFKYVHRDAARQRLSILLDQLAAHVEVDTVACRVHLLELLGLIFGAAGEQTGHRPALVTETASILEKLSRLDSVDELTGAFAASVDTLLGYMEAPLAKPSSGSSLRRAKAYIDQNYATELKIGEVAKQAGVSTSQLQRIFRDALGMIYSAYLTTVRMQRAKVLLASTDRPITEIAFEVGYNDSNYFSTAFRKHEGTSPSQYRRPKPAQG